MQNPAVGNAVITATTPLGIALESVNGVDAGPGYATYLNPQPADSGCSWPHTLAYNTVNATFDVNGYPIELDNNGYWTLPTHWLYSSFLANNQPPDYNEIVLQQDTRTNNATGYSYATQIVPAAPTNGVRFNPSAAKAAVACPNAYSTTTNPPNAEHMPTTYPTTGSTNCAVYIVKDSTSLTPDPSYKGNKVCFTPAGTPGYQYAALSCQNYAGHTYTFFWNDMSGSPPDNTDYADGTLKISCSGPSYVQLID